MYWYQEKARHPRPWWCFVPNDSRLHLQTAENAEVATMKLSSKSGRPFMSFEIIIKTVLTPFLYGYFHPCAVCLPPPHVLCDFLSQGDLMMTSIQDVPIRLLGVEEHNNTTGVRPPLNTPFRTRSLPPNDFLLIHNHISLLADCRLDMYRT